MQLGLCNNRFEKEIHMVSLSHVKAILIWGFMITLDFVVRRKDDLDICFCNDNKEIRTRFKRP